MGKSFSPLKVVEGLDLKRYAGRWYEVACMPSRFQPKNGTNTRATYTLKESGEVGVLNETFVKGKRQSIEGKAWLADPRDAGARLVVRFWVPPFFPLFPVNGDYWVMAVDKENYSYALVGQPSRKFLWVLARSPNLDEETYQKLLKVAQEQGYDTSKLLKTEHVPGVGEGETQISRFEGGRFERTAVGLGLIALAAGATTLILQRRSQSS